MIVQQARVAHIYADILAHNKHTTSKSGTHMQIAQQARVFLLLLPELVTSGRSVLPSLLEDCVGLCWRIVRSSSRVWFCAASSSPCGLCDTVTSGSSVTVGRHRRMGVTRLPRPGSLPESNSAAGHTTTHHTDHNTNHTTRATAGDVIVATGWRERA